MNMPIEKYSPSSGTEGDAFMSEFCYQCARHHTEAEEDADSGECCEIVFRTHSWKVTDPEYPIEWQYGEHGPCCTAFVPIGEPIPEPRCEHTADMFCDEA